MATDDKRRIEKLEDELKQRDRRIKELRDEIDEQRDLIRRMEEQVEDADDVIERWQETFDMEMTERGTSTWKPVPGRSEGAVSTVKIDGSG